MEDYKRHHRIYRSSTNKVFAGVCGGIGEHFDFNPTGVRLLFILFTFMTQLLGGVIVYIILALMMKPAPVERFRNLEEEDFWNTYHASKDTGLAKIEQRVDALNRRLQNMESVVTQPTFGLQDELDRL